MKYLGNLAELDILQRFPFGIGMTVLRAITSGTQLCTKRLENNREMCTNKSPCTQACENHLGVVLIIH